MGSFTFEGSDVYAALRSPVSVNNHTALEWAHVTSEISQGSEETNGKNDAGRETEYPSRAAS